MFRLSRSTDYAIRSLVYLATAKGAGTTLECIAEQQDTPQHFLSKLMGSLRKAGMVRSRRGVGGGYELARKADEITLLDVIEAVEGPLFLNDCLIGPGICPRDTFCPVHPAWIEIQDSFEEILKKYTIQSFIQRSEEAERRAS